MADSYSPSTYAQILIASPPAGKLIQFFGQLQFPGMKSEAMGDYSELATPYQIDTEALQRAIESPFASPMIQNAIHANLHNNAIDHSIQNIRQKTSNWDNALKQYQSNLQNKYEPNDENDQQWQREMLQTIKNKRSQVGDFNQEIDKIEKNYHKIDIDSHFAETVKEQANFHAQVGDNLKQLLESEGYDVTEQVEYFLFEYYSPESLRNEYIESRLGEDVFLDLVSQQQTSLDWQNYAQIKLILARHNLSDIFQNQTAEEVKESIHQQYNQDGETEIIKDIGDKETNMEQEQQKQYDAIKDEYKTIVRNLSEYDQMPLPESMQSGMARKQHEYKTLPKFEKAITDISQQLSNRNVVKAPLRTEAPETFPGGAP